MKTTCIGDALSAGQIRLGLHGDADTYGGSATREQLIGLRLFSRTQFPTGPSLAARGLCKGEIAWELRKGEGAQWHFTMWRPKPEQKAVLCTLLARGRMPSWLFESVVRSGAVEGPTRKTAA